MIDVPPPYLRSNVCIDYQVVEEHDLRVNRLLIASATYNQLSTTRDRVSVNYTKERLQIHKENECVDLQARTKSFAPQTSISIKSIYLGGNRRPPSRRIRESGARERRSRIAGCFEQDRRRCI